MLVFSCRLWTFVIRHRERSLWRGWMQLLSPSSSGEGVWASPWWPSASAEVALLLMTLTSSQRPKPVDTLWPPQCFTILITGRISLMNFHCQHLISVVVVLSTLNTKNMLFLSIAMADENLLSALDWAVFPCRPSTPTTSIFSSWFSGTLHCTSSAALQLHVNPAEALLMISRGGLFYVSLPTYQCVFTAQNPWLTSSFLFTLILIPFWENWADSHSPPCLYSCSSLPKGKILYLFSTAFLRLSLTCNHHAVLPYTSPSLMLSSSLMNRSST